MSLESPDNTLNVRNAVLKVSRVEMNTFSANTVTSNLEVGTANLFVDTVSSNVGVGTNLPLAKLDVKGDIGLVGNIYSNSNLSVQYTTENTTNTWAQVGGDLNGEAAGDNFGHSVALSSDGTRLAVGAILNDGDGSPTAVNDGHVRVFDWSGSAWIQVGADIDAGVNTENFGGSVALSSNGKRLAVGAFQSVAGGLVRVFDLVGGTWTQVGADIEGEAAFDGFGRSVALSSDGTRVAAGGWYNSDTGIDAGHARVFDLVGGTWTQVGGDIDGEAANDFFGISIALSSDGTRLAVGSGDNDGAAGTDSGHVRVFDWDENQSTWTQVGADIDGEAAFDYSGWSIALSSDGTRLAVGSPNADGAAGTDSGRVRVFVESSGVWTQLGADIDGEAASDYFGERVALSSNGYRLAVGAPYNDGSGSSAGHVRVFDWDENQSTWTQVGADIDGTAAGDRFSISVALSSDGRRLAAGATLNDGNGSNAGHVRVFDYGGVLKTKQINKEDIVEIPGDLRAGCPVYFEARRNAGGTGGDPIRWNVVVLNKGGGYNPSTGLFTAPISGVYNISFSTHSSGGAMDVRLTRNGSEVDGGWSYVNAVSYNTSKSMVFNLSQGETVGVRINGGNMYGLLGYNNFSGFYISS